MTTQSPSPAAAPLPDDRRALRNVAVLVTTQGIAGAQMPMIFTIGGLAGLMLSPNPCFATLPVSMIVLGSALSARPLSGFMQRHGRRAGFQIAALAGMGGAGIAALALYQGSLPELTIDITPDADTVEQRMGGGIAKRIGVPEDDQPPRRHLAPRGRAVMFEHIRQRLEQQIQIGLGKPGPFRELGRDEAMRDIQPVGYDMLATHGAVVRADIAVLTFGAFLLFSLVGGSHAGNRDLDRQHRLDRTGEGHLHRPLDLPAIDAGRHDRAEGPHVEEIRAHEIAQLQRLGIVAGVQLRVLHRLGIVRAQCDIGLAVLFVQDSAFLHIDMMPGLALTRQFDIVADLALKADIADQPVIGLGVQPRQVAGIWVAIRIAIRHIENQHEIMASGQCGHAASSEFAGLSCLRKKSERWW